MKKLLSIALVLVFALSLAAPALAYTTIVAEGSLFSVDIYLVDYSNAIALFGGRSLSLPASNRAYGVNEVVAAIASFTVPATTDIMDFYGSVRFSTNNISMAVADNMIGANRFGGFTNDVTRAIGAGVSTATNRAFATTGAGVLLDDDTVVSNFDTTTGFGQMVIGDGFTRAQTYSFLVFGKVLDDDADMTISLRNGADFATLNDWDTGIPARHMPFNGSSSPTNIGEFANATTSQVNNTYNVNEFLVLSDDYIVYRSADRGARQYYVSDQARAGNVPNVLLIFEVGANNETQGVVYYDAGAAYRFFMTPSGDVAINNTANGADVAATNPSLYNRLLAGFNALFDDLGLTLSNRTNLMTNAYWTGLANANDISETVSIDPLALPYIQVPEVEVTEPPKTGSAASILGFVIIAMAGVAAVVVRKVRA